MYYILHKDGKLVGISKEEPIPELSGIGILAEGIEEDMPDLNLVQFNPETLTLEYISKTKLTNYRFKLRFTSQERIAAANSTDPIVRDLMEMLDSVPEVDVTEPLTIQGIYYLSQVGIIAPSRVQEILVEVN